MGRPRVTYRKNGASEVDSLAVVMNYLGEQRYYRDKQFFDQVMSLDTWQFIDWAELAPIDSLERFCNFVPEPR
jgi:hypothetical protein